MKESNLDILLRKHFHPPSADRLTQLEADVWRRIRIAETNPGLGERLREWLLPEWHLQYRYAPVAFALVIGLSAGTLTSKIDAIFLGHYSTTKMLSLDVFSADYSKLPSNMINTKL